MSYLLALRAHGQGQLRLAADNFALELAPLFAKPWQYRRANALLQWRISPDDVTISSPLIQLDGVVGQLAGDLMIRLALDLAQTTEALVEGGVDWQVARADGALDIGAHADHPAALHQRLRLAGLARTRHPAGDQQRGRGRLLLRRGQREIARAFGEGVGARRALHLAGPDRLDLPALQHHARLEAFLDVVVEKGFSVFCDGHVVARQSRRRL